MNHYLDIANRDLLVEDARYMAESQEWDDFQRAREERAFDLSDPKPARRVTRAQANRAGALPGVWRDRVLERDQGCRVHSNPADCGDGWAAHHIVLAQELRRVAPECVWNPLSGMGVCGLAHRQHHNRGRPIALLEVPPVCVAYLRAHGLGPWLERHYELVPL